MKLFVGTSGYSYKEWKGSFYPEKMKNEEMLAFYAERFNTVELNNTFYRAPNEKNLQAWHDTVGKDFTFTLKASRKITHVSRLKESCKETLDYVIKVSETLKKKQGPTLFQLPPNSKKDSERLKAFLDWLPKKKLYTFEFRNLSWFDDEIFKLLKNKDIALCYSDGEVEGEPFQPTSSWGYMRLRRIEYNDQQLKDWVSKIKDTDWQSAYVYFKHEDEATGPRLAQRFLELF